MTENGPESVAQDSFRTDFKYYQYTHICHICSICMRMYTFDKYNSLADPGGAHPARAPLTAADL